MTENDISVLIIGAGPTGLMMANQLAMRGIDYRIIEKKLKPSYRSKALAIQARSLEIFQQMGLVNEFLQEGEIAADVSMIVRGKIAGVINLTNIGQNLSPFPYLFILEQSKTEQILIKNLEKLDKKIEWGTELIKITQTQDQAVANIRLANGEIIEITSDWVVGAGGAHSPLRHAMNVSFDGAAYEQKFLLTDAKVDWDLSYEGLKICLDAKSFGGFFPMKGSQRYRVIGSIPVNREAEDLDFKDIKEVMENAFHFPISLSDSRWHAVYKLHHRCVNKFREGRFILAGDAAHIHSPAGGQGMNTGLQDAYNLAWKLASVIQGSANEKLLDSYHDERIRVAKHLVSGTDRGFSLGISRNPVVVFLRLFIFPYLFKAVTNFNAVRNFMFRFVSQIAINYQKVNTIFNYNTSTKLKAGDRLPYVQINDEQNGIEKSIFKLLANTKFNLLILGNDEALSNQTIQKIATERKELMEVYVIPTSNIDCYRQFGITRETYILVRPDMHIAMLGNDLDDANKYFKHFNFS